MARQTGFAVTVRLFIPASPHDTAAMGAIAGRVASAEAGDVTALQALVTAGAHDAQVKAKYSSRDAQTLLDPPQIAAAGRAADATS
jgi:hypothetical protein